jgi:hypothetical protein
VRTIRLRVTLREVIPTVARVLDVPAGARLPEVHDLLQAGLGWTDSHLHQFLTSDALYGMPDLDGPEEEQDESPVRLRDMPAEFVYLYDFGDSWEHDMEILGAGGERPGCVDGEGPCPPEDCGGPGGYAELLEALADPHHEDHAAMQTWVGALPTFERESTDLLVRQTVGAVPAPVRLLLEQTTGGITLTPGGRLPRTLVRDVQGHYPDWHSLDDRPASIEEDLPPLAALHDLLRTVGLLRLRHGVITPIRAAADDMEVIRRLRSWFAPAEGFTDLLAGVALAVLAAGGSQSVDELARRVYPWFEHDWATGDGTPVGPEHLSRELRRLTTVLTALDAITTDFRTWSPGPSACWLLPRATGLADLWLHAPARYPPP